MPDFGRWTPNGGDPSLNEINRADRFIDALSENQPVYSTDAAEAELAFLLADWRDGVRDAPVTVPVTPRDAAIALQGGLSDVRRTRRSFAVVGSVAAAMLFVGGFGAAVYGSGPGDALYGMRTSLFGQELPTRNDQVALASAELQQVQQLIDQGQWQQAQDKLVALSSTVENVEPVERKELVEQWNTLTYKVIEQDPAATLPPGEPLPALPSSPLTWLPVPVIETPTSESTVTTEPSDSSVPPTILLTPPPETSTSSPTGPSSTTTPPPSTTTTPPPPSTTTTPPPPSTTTTTAPPSATTTTTTTRVVQVPPSQSVGAKPPVSQAPQPRVAPNSPRTEVPAPTGETGSVVSSSSEAPTTSSVLPESGDGDVVTTTTAPPGSG